MPSKKNYQFNKETLTFDTPTETKWQRFSKKAVYFLYSLGMALIIVLLMYVFVDSPKEIALKRENSEILSQYQLLNSEVEQLEDVLTALEMRDDNIYRVVFESEPISQSIRRAGSGGVNRYEYLEHLKNAELVVETAKKVENLSKGVFIQSKSYDEIEKLVSSKVQMMACIPAILPVPMNKKTQTYWISSAFGNRMHPYYKIVKFHSGMDFACAAGTPIYATGDGKVIVSDVEKAAGKYVTIDHGFNHQTLYAHLSKSIVVRGQKVKRGEIIGYVGSTGMSTGPHLHYEVRKNGKAVNPINYYFNDLTADEFDTMLTMAENTGQTMD